MERTTIIYILSIAAVLILLAVFMLLSRKKKSLSPLVGEPEKPDQQESIGSSISPSEEILDENRFWQIERGKRLERSEIFQAFNQKEAPSLSSASYKVGQLAKVAGTETEQAPKDRFDSIKEIHKDAPLAKLRKISKRPDSRYMKALMDKTKKTKTAPTIKDKLRKVSGKRSKAFSRLKRLKKKL